MKRYFSPSEKKVIFFDLNHTLIDQKQSFRNCFIEVLNEFTGRWSPDANEWNPNEIFQRYEKKWTKVRQIKRKSKPSPIKLQFSSLRDALQPYPIVVNDDFLQSFFKQLKQQKKKHIQLYPNTIRILSKLAKLYKLAIISNNNDIDVRTLGLSNLFDTTNVFTSQQSRHKKPHPAIFKYALRAMKVKASESVMVGDSWRYDILGASRCKIDAVWIQRQPIRKNPEKNKKSQIIIIRDLNQLLEIF